jgi:Cu-Zn family superoxide dismutase
MRVAEWRESGDNTSMNPKNLLVAFLASASIALTALPVRADDVPVLVAQLLPTEGSSVSGMVTFTDAGGGKVKVVADVKGLEPNSKHGFHIHEFGDVSMPDGMATGGHFNPEKHDHALPTTEIRHAGDFGNLEANAAGEARLELTVDNITLTSGKDAIIGRGVIVHAKLDDGSQPVGNAGARAAQGVIGVKNPADKK